MAERMSDVEALMWTLEKDPHLSSTFANVTVLDRPPDVDRLRRRMDRALAVVPRLRQRVVPGFGRLSPPAWEVQEEIDLDWHVRRLALPAPGDQRALLDLAATLAAEPFDRTRPLWRFTIVEGLDGGRAAMVAQIHHTITDGEGGVRISADFLDLERDAPEPAPHPVAEVFAATDPSLLGPAIDTVGHTGRRLLGVALRALEEGTALARHPDRAIALAGVVATTLPSLGRQLAVTDPARSPLWTVRTLRRRLEVMRVPLDEVRRAAKGLGGSVNDVFVAAVAGGAGSYHRRRGAAVDELRMAMPISTRVKGHRTGNAFAPTRSVVSVTADPILRFAQIQETLAATRLEPAVRLALSVAGVANLLPTAVLVRTVRGQVETVDFTTSNVRGAPFELFVAGARIDANYPIGPIAGTAFNATVLSVAGSLDIGLHCDAGAVEHPAELRDDIALAFDELLSLPS